MLDLNLPTRVFRAGRGRLKNSCTFAQKKTNTLCKMKNRKNGIALLVCAMCMLALAGCNGCSNGFVKKQKSLEVKSYALCDTVELSSDGDGQMVFVFDMEMPVAATGDTAAISVMQDEIKRQLFAGKFVDLPFDSAMSCYRDFVVSNYRIAFKSVAKELVDKIQESADTLLVDSQRETLDNELYITAGINFDSMGVVSYSVEQIINFGDATNISRVQYINFNRADGSVLNEQTLYVEGYEKDLTNLLLNSMIEQTDDIALIKDLEDNDYEVNSIRPNDNFYFSSAGVIYEYNLVDIGPYIPEGTQVLVSWSKLKPLLRPEWQYLAGA